MSEIAPLRLAQVCGPDLRLHRSAIRWQRGFGEHFNAGDLLGHCNVTLVNAARNGQTRHRLEPDLAMLQIALVARVSGCLQEAPGTSAGGFADFQEWFPWESDTVVANVAIDSDAHVTPGQPLYDTQFVTGRPITSLAENRTGLGTGWVNRKRAWRTGDGSAADTGTVLGLGICELPFILRGEQGSFEEMLEAATGPVQLVDIPDIPIIHSARTIIQQIEQTQSDRNAVEAEFKRAIGESAAHSDPEDWIFAATCVAELNRDPTNETYQILSADGLSTAGPANAIILSINSEHSSRLRHRKLGFYLDCHTFRISSLGPAMRNWLKAHFEWVPYSTDMIRRDYTEMMKLLRKADPHRQILVLNAASTLRREDVMSYAAFDAPLENQLKSVQARALNSMLHDMAEETGIAIVDCDAIAARLGSSICVPDAVHQNGEMQTAIRQEILAILAARQVPGFCR